MRKYTDIKGQECQEILKREKGARTNIKCPDCNGTLIVREGISKFLGCSKFPSCRCMVGFPVRGGIDFRSPELLRREQDKVEYLDEEYEDDGIGIHCADDM